MTSRAAGPPALAGIAPLRPPAIRHHVLDCGLDVFLVERPELPVVDARLVFRAGAAAVAPELAGQAFLTARLLDQGTVGRDANTIADETELIGASIETRASWDATSIALHVLTARLAPALDLLADIALRPTFPDAELERQRARRLAAILQERDDPRMLASHAFAAAVYGEHHPYGSPVGGVTDTVQRISLDEVHAFHSRHARPDHAFLAIAGDVQAEALIPALERLFTSWHPEASHRPDTASSGAPITNLPQSPRTLHIVDRPAAPQSELRVGLAGPPRSAAEYFPLLLGNTVLGGTFMSRLNILLREEKAYTYGAGSSCAFRAGGGPFVASTAVATAATADAVQDIVNEVGRLAREPVAEPELERARNYLTLGLPRAFETTRDIVERVSEVALHGLGLDYHARYASAVAGVTAEEIQRAAARWLKPEELSIVIVGDAAVILKDLEALEIGAVHVRTTG